MVNRERLVEQHALEYLARLKHLDETSQAVGAAMMKSGSALDQQMLILQQERERYLEHIEQLRHEVRSQWQENGIEDVGPMVVWEAVAKRLGQWFIH